MDYQEAGDSLGFMRDYQAGALEGAYNEQNFILNAGAYLGGVALATAEAVGR
jgi:hypothetical protein